MEELEIKTFKYKILIKIIEISNEKDEFKRKLENWRYSVKNHGYGLLEDEKIPIVAIEETKGYLNIYGFNNQNYADYFAYNNNGLVFNIEKVKISIIWKEMKN